jgi:DNA/RNA-binding domain of Phe-tRNA-synthetase-like protein
MKMITIHSEIKEKCPAIRLGAIFCTVKIEEDNSAIWTDILAVQEALKSIAKIEEVSQHPVNSQTRDAYRRCGKKPGRYRPSAEALMRRVLQGKDLYRINNVVDMINMVSIETGFSIGGYDADKIEGDIELGIGKENEPYAALGRGAFNIHKLPRFKDDLGAFGSPTSDSERTGVSSSTQNFLMIFLDFGKNEILEPAMNRAKEALSNYCSATDIEMKLIE